MTAPQLQRIKNKNKRKKASPRKRKGRKLLKLVFPKNQNIPLESNKNVISFLYVYSRKEKL